MRRLLLASIAALMLAPVAEAHTLTADRALRAAQRVANAAGKQRVYLAEWMSLSRHAYSVSGTYTTHRNVYCERCNFDFETGQFLGETIRETNNCYIDLRVRFRSRRSYRVRVRITRHICY